AAIPTSGVLRVFELFFDVTIVEQPDLELVALGVVEDTNQPTVAWTPVLDLDGGPQTHYQVRVFTAAQYGAGGFDPATSTAAGDTTGVGSAVGWQGDETLPDAPYRGSARVAQTVNGVVRFSAWEYSEFEIDVALPATPTLAATADNTNGRIALALTDNQTSTIS